ncbi:MAG: glycosyltransferase [Treponemataceae bacterium]|nr:glycosyltransferase [Treponemataceae bacterium]
MPKISIIVPIYNAAKYLSQCIESILNQTFTDFELILVNDGSTDESESICLKYKASDSRVKYVLKENGGAASARKAGLENATAEYVGWVDSDDWIDVDMFYTLYESSVAQNADIAACGVIQEYADRKNMLIPNACEYQKSIDLLLFSYCNKIIKRELFTKSNISFPIGTAEYEDVSVTFKLISNTNKISFIPKAFYHYRMSNVSVTHSLNVEKLVQNRLAVTENNLDYSKTHSINAQSKILAERMILTAKQNYLDNLQIFNPKKWRSIHPEINYWKLLSFYPFYNKILFVLALLKLDGLLWLAVKVKDIAKKKLFSKLY